MTLIRCFGCKAGSGLIPPEGFGGLLSGRQARCKPCINRFGRLNRAKTKRRRRQVERESYYRIDADPTRKVNRLRLRFKIGLKFNFGIDVETYARIAHAQNLMCAICPTPLLFDRNTHLDHCHATERVRGLLCGPCNLMLGGARDDPRILTSAVEYLGRYLAT